MSDYSKSDRRILVAQAANTIIEIITESVDSNVKLIVYKYNSETKEYDRIQPN